MGGSREREDDDRERHLCKLAKRGEIAQIRPLVKDAAWICAKCGRVSREQDRLCRPEPL